MLNLLKEVIVDIDAKEKLFEPYNHHQISMALIEYLINSVNPYKYNNKYTIVLNNRLDIEITPLIKKALKDEYLLCVKRYKRNNILQTVYLLVGIFILFLSMRIGEDGILKEMLIISGWVLIWNIFEIEMFSDSPSNRRRKALKRLINSSFIEQRK